MSEKPLTISELRLESYVAGELSSVEARRIENAALADEGLAARIAAIRASNEEILSAYPPETMAGRIDARRIEAKPIEAKRMDQANRQMPKAGASRKSTFIWALPAAAALAIGIGLVFAVGSGRFAAQSGLESTRMKGGSPHLLVYRKAASGAELLADGAQAKKKDLLQIGYYAGSEGYGAIFSIDGRGTLTFHLPEGPASGSAPSIDTIGESLLASAYELDDAPYYERFFFVFSAKPFALSEVEAVASALAADPRSAQTAAPSFPPGLAWTSFIIIKGSPR